MAYVADPTNAAKPADADDASGGAAELRALKAYLQTLLNNGTSIPVNGYAWRGFRNQIINGNFDIWQRGTSLASAVNNAYLADRWFTQSAGSTSVISQQAFVLGQTAVPYEPKFFHRTAVTSVAAAGNFCLHSQRVEGVRTLAGQSGILSFWAKADAVKNIAVEFQQIFGTGGAPSAAVSGIAVATKAMGTGWQFYTVPVTLPSITGKTLGSNGDDCVGINFWFDAGSTFNSRTNSLGQQSGTFDIAQVQFEPGTNATPFELIQLPEVNRRCRQYYRRIYGCSGIFQSATLATVGVEMHGDPMRASPTAGFSGTGQLLDPGSAFRDVLGIAVNSVQATGGYIDLTTSGATAGRTAILAQATGWVDLTAEL